MTNAKYMVNGPFKWLRRKIIKKGAIKRALECQGWTGKPKLSLLFELAQQTNTLDGDILEIGSAWGRSIVLLAYASGKQILSIDPHTGGRAYIEKGEQQNSYEAFQANLAKYGIASRVKIFKSTTQEVLKNKQLPHSLRLSMVFIDGLHTAEGVEIDFALAYERMVRNSVMVFDDYYEESVPDYSRKIDEIVYKHDLNLTKDDRSRLVYFKKRTG